jgi:hypothetical protein
MGESKAEFDRRTFSLRVSGQMGERVPRSTFRVTKLSKTVVDRRLYGERNVGRPSSEGGIDRCERVRKPVE